MDPGDASHIVYGLFDEVSDDDDEFFDDLDEEVQEGDDDEFEPDFYEESDWSDEFVEDPDALEDMFAAGLSSREANAEYWEALGRVDWHPGCTFDAENQRNPDSSEEDGSVTTDTYTLVDVSKASTLAETRSGNTHHQTQDAICVSSALEDTAVMAVMSPVEISFLRKGSAEAATHNSNLESGVPAFARLQRVGTIPCHRSTYSGAFTPDGRLYVHCGSNPGLFLWSLHPRSSNTKPELDLQRCMPVFLPSHTSPDPTTTRELVLEQWSTMLNCVRVGLVAGTERLIVAGQDGYIRILEVPHKAVQAAPTTAAAVGDGIAVFQEMVCRSLRRGSNPCLDFVRNGLDVTYTQRTVLRRRDATPVDVPEADRARTVALGPLPTAVNCADVSPDGRWMAVAGDCLQVLLLPEALDYCHFAAKALDMNCEDLASASRSEGCQYVAWSPNGEFLAASSDSHHCVAVWKVTVPDESAMTPTAILADLRKACEVKRGGGARGRGRRGRAGGARDSELDQTLLAHLTGAAAEWPTFFGAPAASAADRTPAAKRLAAWRVVSEAFWQRVSITPVALFHNHLRPCLAVQWHPRAPSLLFYTQERATLTAVDLQCPQGSRQDISLTDLPSCVTHPSPSVVQNDHVFGLCVVGDRVVVALANSMVSLPPVLGWSKAVHQFWPPRFKSAVRVLLLNDCFGAARREARTQAAGAAASELELCNLPAGVIERIIAFAAEPRAAWCEARAVGA